MPCGKRQQNTANWPNWRKYAGLAPCGGGTCPWNLCGDCIDKSPFWGGRKGPDIQEIILP